MAAPTTSSASASLLIRKQPKIIKSRQDHSLYVKLSDLPEDIQEQLRLGSEEAENISEGAETEETSQPYDDVFGGPSSSSHQSRARCNKINSVAFDEPMRLSAQPTVEEIQMCFAQIDLAILMNHHGHGKLHSRSRSASPRKLHRHSSSSLAEAAPPLRPAAAAAHRTLSPSPRCKAKQTAQQRLPSSSPPPPPASPPTAAAASASAPAPASKSKEYSPDRFIPDEVLTHNKNEGWSSGVKQSKNMEELLNCIGKRQGKNATELKNKKGENKAMEDEHHVNHHHHQRHDEDDYKDDDDDNDEDENDEDEEKGDRGGGRSRSRLRKKKNETSSRRFCGGLSLLRDDLKAKLQQMHSKVLPLSGDACIYDGLRSKGVWSKDTHHVRYKSSWSGTSQEEYQIEPNQESDDE